MAIRTEDDTALDFLANTRLRVAIDNHRRDTVFLLVWVMKIQARRSIFIAPDTLAMPIFVRIEPLTDLRPATMRSSRFL